MEEYLAGHFNGLSLVLLAVGLLILLYIVWPRKRPQPDRYGHIWTSSSPWSSWYDPTCARCGKPASKVAGTECWPTNLH